MNTAGELPEVTLENWREWSEFYTNRQPTPKQAKRIARLMRVILGGAHIHYRTGAREALAARPVKTTKAISANHTADADPLHLAAAVQRSPAGDLLGNAGIPSKLEVFNWSTFLRKRIIDPVGTYPNVGNRDLPVDPTPHQLEEFEKAKEAGRQLTRFKLLNVDVLGVFQEGTRGREPGVVLPFKYSFANTVTAISDERTVENYGMGICYGTDVNPRTPGLAWLHPTIVIDKPTVCDTKDAGELMELYHASTQSCVTEAFERRAESPLRRLIR